MPAVLVKSLLTVSSLTLVSRILGFIRDVLIARQFGAGLLTDAFFVAFRIPNLLRRLFAEGAFSQAFVPLLGKYRHHNTGDALQHFINRIYSLLLVSTTIIAALGVVFAPTVVWLTASGFIGTPAFDTTVSLLRLTFPYIVMISMVSFAGGILNTWQRFSIPAITPATLNISFIIATIWLAPKLNQPIMALGWAVLVGGLVQVMLQIPALINLRLLPRFDFQPKNSEVSRFLKLMAPATLGVSVSQISLLINTTLASQLKTGSISWIYYADRLMEFPAGLLGAALGTILLPGLSKAYNKNDYSEYATLLDWGMRITLILSVPAALAMAIFNVPLVTALFDYGKFSGTDAINTGQALAGYAIGLPALILIKILAPGYYATQNIKTPVYIGIFTLVVTQIMNALLIPLCGHTGLTLAISIGAIVNAFLLWLGLRKLYKTNSNNTWKKFFWQLGLANAVLGSILYLGEQWGAPWIGQRGPARILELTAICMIAALGYALALKLSGVPIKELLQKKAA